MAKAATVEDLEAFWDLLQGRMGMLLRLAGAVMAQRMEERKVEWSDLSDDQVMDLFHSAFMQVAPSAYPELPAEEVDELVQMTFADIAMQLRANAEASERVH
ncbi:hypothetical protein BZG35_03520 [Brevundimonas sp. LM2]|uniref:hypothetical protein n=1 Tax=Brevundimonas sp. LM2 TaxID=1938605 RepID=UPI00098408DE|nr:hypothetical protein [Brevundimonas sp. LM2]AQR60825.1 hypothetical protein BZG35_03520 [Brevundimonas sp. LM2]